MSVWNILERLLAAGLDQLVPGFGRESISTNPESAVPGAAGVRQGDDSSLRMVRRKWRILPACAAGLDVVQPHQFGTGLRRVMISTMSPLRSSVRSGTRS